MKISHPSLFGVCPMVALAVLFVAPNPTASAWTEQEYQFVEDLRSMGFATTVGVDEAIPLGWSICDQLANGYNAAGIANSEAQRSGFPKQPALAIISAANRNLCPDL